MKCETGIYLGIQLHLCYEQFLITSDLKRNSNCL